MPPSCGINFAISNVVNSFKLGGVPSLILDSFSAGAAFSTRLLRTNYGVSSPCVRVRRTPDNVLANIPFKLYAGRTSPYWLDEEALLAHCGSGSGFVHTWYDQTVNARHVSQTTNANQPRIVNAGVIDKENGFPVIVFNGTDQVLKNSFPFLYAAGTATIFAVAKGGALNDKALHGEGNSATITPTYVLIGKDQGKLFSYLRNNTGTATGGRFGGVGPSGWNLAFNQYFAKDTGTQFIRSFNGTTFTENYTRHSPLTLDVFAVGGSGWGNSSIDVSLGEFIAFPSALSNTDINTISLNEGGAYSITVNPI